MIVAGFPGIGKSYYCGLVKGKLEVIDMDSSQYSWSKPGVRNPNFVDDYVDAIEKRTEQNPDAMIFVSTHAGVLEELQNRGQKFVVVVPRYNQKQEYLQRYKNRKSSQEFIDNIDANWQSWLEDIQNTYPHEIRVMDEGETLSEYLVRIYETSEK